MLQDTIKKLERQILKVPNDPGIYLFKDTNKNILYVGKAVKLRTRLRYYVDKYILQKNPKTLKMIQEAVYIDYFLTNTEVEALVLESKLIKKYQPSYNVSLKDDKSYKLIEIIKSADDSYKIGTARKKSTKASYFGPFPSSRAINVVLRDVRKLIPYRNCSDNKFFRYKKLKKPCLYGHLGLCPAPCQGSAEILENNENVAKIKKFLRGEYKTILKDMRNMMGYYSKNMEYENAAEIRDKLAYYDYLSQRYKSTEELLEDIGNLDNNNKALEELIRIINFYFKKKDTNDSLDKFRIEFYDISNLGDKIIVGSMITLIGGQFDKNFYRKFKIRKQTAQDDFRAMQEVLNRRFLHLRDWGIPDLLVIDGGKGQLSKIVELTEQKNISAISLAKKNETVYLRKEGKYVRVDLPLSNLALKLLIKGRNEVHRFGLEYNRKLRKISN